MAANEGKGIVKGILLSAPLIQPAPGTVTPMKASCYRADIFFSRKTSRRVLLYRSSLCHHVIILATA